MIQTEAEHQATLARIEKLWESPLGSEDGIELDRLIDQVIAYEEIHYPEFNATK